MILLLLGGFSTVPVLAQQARFDEATVLLEHQEYRKAIGKYLDIADDGHQAGALWFNLGVAYSHLDSLGMAKFYFLKASEYRETQPASQEAVQFVNDRFSRRSAVLPALPWERFFDYLNVRIGSSGLFSIALGFFYLGIAGIILYWFFPALRSLYYYPGLGAVMFSLILFITAFYVQYRDHRYNTAVLIERQSEVFESPDPDSPRVSMAYEGYTMRVDNKQSKMQQGWYYIRLENGMYGWINDQSIKVL